jgi:hypothetical protein
MFLINLHIKKKNRISFIFFIMISLVRIVNDLNSIFKLVLHVFVSWSSSIQA